MNGCESLATKAELEALKEDLLKELLKKVDLGSFGDLFKGQVFQNAGFIASVIVGVIIGLITTLVTQILNGTTAPQIAAIEAKIAKLEELEGANAINIKDLYDKISPLEAKTNAAIAAAAAAQKDASAAIGALNAVIQSLNNLDGRLSTLENVRIPGLEANLNAAIEGFQKLVASLESSLNEALNRINQLEIAIEWLKSDITQLEILQSIQSVKIAMLENEVAKLAYQYWSLQADVLQIGSQIILLKLDTSNLNEKVNYQKTLITALEAKVAELEAKKANKTEVAGGISAATATGIAQVEATKATTELGGQIDTKLTNIKTSLDTLKPTITNEVTNTLTNSLTTYIDNVNTKEGTEIKTQIGQLVPQIGQLGQDIAIVKSQTTPGALAPTISTEICKSASPDGCLSTNVKSNLPGTIGNFLLNTLLNALLNKILDALTPEDCVCVDLENVNINEITCTDTVPTATAKSIPTIAGTAAQTTALFGQLEKISTALCTLKNDIVPAIPDSWQIRPEGNRPQLIIQFGEVLAGSKFGAPHYIITIPHPASSTIPTAALLSEYVRGNIEGILTLKDNSKVIVHCETAEKANSLLDAIQLLIKANYLVSSFRKIGERKGQPIAVRTVTPRIIKYFSAGQQNLKPDWVKYLYE